MSAGDDARERELERFLRRVEPERPAPAVREAARRAFLEACEAGDGNASRRPAATRTGGAMPADREAQFEASAEELEAFEAWLAAQPPAAPPRAEARRHARLAFLTAVATGAPARPRPRRFQAAVLLLAAAAILTVTFFLPEPERWRARLDGVLRFDSRAFGPGEEGRLAAALEASGWVETGPARARFALGRELDLELSPAAALSFPVLPELDGASPLDFELTRGEAYLRTAATYPGNPIRVRTELADVDLSGTTVGVLVDELGTCVCVAQGTARVTSARLAGGSQEVEARRTLFLFRDPSRGTESQPFPAAGSPDSGHTRGLLEFHASP